jgi:protein-S-isoprenylcysteine O-methyltransferase Ste14
VVYPFFLKVRADVPLFGIGLAVYGWGIIVYTASTISYARPDKKGINKNGLYHISRNPMNIGYFIYFLGFVLLTRSIELFIALIVFQISAHWIILSEERWCINEFGESYVNYMKKVRRYL